MKSSANRKPSQGQSRKAFSGVILIYIGVILMFIGVILVFIGVILMFIGVIFLFYFSFSLIEISLHTKFQLPTLPVSGPKVCGGGWWWVVGV